MRQDGEDQMRTERMEKMGGEKEGTIDTEMEKYK